MREYIWAAATIGFLILFRLLISLKNKETGALKTAFQYIGLGSIALAIWSGLNSLRSNSMTAKGLSFEADISIAIIAGLALACGIVFAGAGAMNFLPLAKNMLHIPGYRRLITKIAENIAVLPNEDNCNAFMIDVGKEMVRILRPEFYQIERMEKEGRARIIARYNLQNDNCIGAKQNESERNLKASELCDCKKTGNEVRLEFSDGGGNSYAITLCFRNHLRKPMDSAGYELIVSLVNGRLKLIARATKAEKKLAISDRQNILFRITGEAEDISAYLKKAFPTFAKSTGCDYISLAVLDNTIQNMYRYTYVEMGGILQEKGICYPLKQTITQKVASEKKMLVTGTLESGFYRDDYYLHKAGFSSRMAYPIVDFSGTIKGVLTLAAVRPAMFEHITLSSMEFANHPLCRLIEFHNANNLMRNLKRQIVSGFNLTFGLKQGGLPGDFYGQTARILSETLPATMCRIWGYDQQANRLTSLAYHNLHTNDRESAAPNEGVGLELLPRHKTAVSMGKALVINQSNPESRMDENEIRALGLPGMKSAILAPMRLRDKTLGIVSIGELRNWQRRSFGPQELLYSQIIAAIAALVNLVDHKDRDLARFSRQISAAETASQLYNIFGDFPARLSSPVSAILGASQIIGQKYSDGGDELIRFNRIILKSANAIVDELNKFRDIKQSLV